VDGAFKHGGTSPSKNDKFSNAILTAYLLQKIISRLIEIEFTKLKHTQNAPIRLRNSCQKLYPNRRRVNFCRCSKQPVDTISPNQSQAEIILFAVDRFFGV
jgi:hypothetical protein